MRRSDKISVVGVLLAVAIIAAYFTLSHRPARVQAPVAGALPTTPGHYLGVAKAGEIGTQYRPIDEFARTIGRQPNIVLYYSAWGDPFQAGLADQARQHHAAVFVQLDPDQSTRMAAVAAGRYDRYLTSYAQEVVRYRYPVIVGFAPEMNGDWDSWGWMHTSPATWVAAWRHVVTLFRRLGATNVTWIWTLNASSNGTGPVQRWWPGSAYVTWVGIDGYYFYSASTFASTFQPTIDQVRAMTKKPILISETGIGQEAGQARKMADLFNGMRAAQVLGFVWFDQNQADGVYHQHWRLEGNSQAVAAFRHELAESS